MNTFGIVLILVKLHALDVIPMPDIDTCYKAATNLLELRVGGRAACLNKATGAVRTFYGPSALRKIHSKERK